MTAHIATPTPSTRGIDIPWSRRDNAWFREEAIPCGDAGSLSFHYRAYSFKEQIAPDISDCLATRPRPHILVIWEPLLTKAPRPPKARPHCCYINTIIFYHRPYIVSPWRKIWICNGRYTSNATPGSFEEWDKIESRFHSHDDIVIFEGERFALSSGTVMWKRRRWWMRHGARRVREDG